MWIDFDETNQTLLTELAMKNHEPSEYLSIPFNILINFLLSYSKKLNKSISIK